MMGISVTACGGTFEITYGQYMEVRSPTSEPHSYPPYSSCEWKISANKSTVLNISVIYMDLEDCKYAFYDYVRIYRGIDQNRTMITELCKKPSNDIFITGNATILFKSDGTISKRGFLIAVNAARGKQWFMVVASILTLGRCVLTQIF